MGRSNPTGGNFLVYLFFRIFFVWQIFCQIFCQICLSWKTRLRSVNLVFVTEHFILTMTGFYWTFPIHLTMALMSTYFPTESKPLPPTLLEIEKKKSEPNLLHYVIVITNVMVSGSTNCGQYYNARISIKIKMRYGSEIVFSHFYDDE